MQQYQPPQVPQPGAPQYVYVHGKRHNRNKGVAAVLALFLGGLGAHKFYLGQTGSGLLYLLFFWTWIPAIIAFVEAIIYLTKSDEDFDRMYNY